MQVANNYMKRCPTSLVIMEIQDESTIRCHYTPTRVIKIKKIDETKYW